MILCFGFFILNFQFYQINPQFILSFTPANFLHLRSLSGYYSCVDALHTVPICKKKTY